jgi:hypothetical protein
MPFCFHKLYNNFLEYLVVKLLHTGNSVLIKPTGIRNHLQELRNGVGFLLRVTGVNYCNKFAGFYSQWKFITLKA